LTPEDFPELDIQRGEQTCRQFTKAEPVAPVKSNKPYPFRPLQAALSTALAMTPGMG
jgi:hypothetical protein